MANYEDLEDYDVELDYHQYLVGDDEDYGGTGDWYPPSGSGPDTPDTPDSQSVAVSNQDTDSVDYMDYIDETDSSYDMEVDNSVSTSRIEDTTQGTDINYLPITTANVIPFGTSIIFLNACFFGLISIAQGDELAFHFSTAAAGMALLNILYDTTGTIQLMVCFLLSYILLISSNYLKRKSNISIGTSIKIVSISSIILCEYFLVDPYTWRQIRIVLIILVMKLISVADDMDSGLMMPSASQYFGYVLCGANVIIGPWISYETYRNLFYARRPIKISNWIVGICQTFVISLIFLSLSNCCIQYFLPHNSNKWLLVFRNIVIFRANHYFICYLSEAGMIAAGFRNTRQRVHRYIITEPFTLEFSTTLMAIIAKWNQPMYAFLGKYFYRRSRFHSRFLAVTATLMMAFFLHSFDLKFLILLIQIIVFGQLQKAPRAKLAEIFDCCIQVNPCRVCRHKYKRNDIRVRIILFIFSLASLLHLIHLEMIASSLPVKTGDIWTNIFLFSQFIVIFKELFRFFKMKITQHN